VGNLELEGSDGGPYRRGRQRSKGVTPESRGESKFKRVAFTLTRIKGQHRDPHGAQKKISDGRYQASLTQRRGGGNARNKSEKFRGIACRDADHHVAMPTTEELKARGGLVARIKGTQSRTAGNRETSMPAQKSAAVMPYREGKSLTRKTVGAYWMRSKVTQGKKRKNCSATFLPNKHRRL